jgi:hypothetical protein
MCEPTTIALVAGFAGSGVAAYSSYESGQAQKALANTNARLADEQAADSTRRGQIEEDRRRALTRQQLGAQRVALGANNVVSSTGTPLGLLAETAEYGELDALTIRNNAAREAFGYKVEAGNSRTRGRIASREGTLGAFSTILGGGAQAYGSYRKNRSGAGGGGAKGITPGGTRVDVSARSPSTRGYA